jgi:hypothetical protein
MGTPDALTLRPMAGRIDLKSRFPIHAVRGLLGNPQHPQEHGWMRPENGARDPAGDPPLPWGSVWRQIPGSSGFRVGEFPVCSGCFSVTALLPALDLQGLSGVVRLALARYPAISLIPLPTRDPEAPDSTSLRQTLHVGEKYPSGPHRLRARSVPAHGPLRFVSAVPLQPAGVPVCPASTKPHRPLRCRTQSLACPPVDRSSAGLDCPGPPRLGSSKAQAPA